MKAAFGESIHSRGTQKRTTRREVCWVQGAGGRVTPENPLLYLRASQVSRLISFTHPFIQPLLYGTGSTTRRGAGWTGQGAGDRKGTGEGGPAVSGRNGSPRGASLREHMLSWCQRPAGTSSLLPVPHTTEAFPSLHEDLFTAPKTADTE